MKLLEAEHNKKIFIIEEDPDPDWGVYFYVYEDGKCIRDYLQDDISICKRAAFEDYGVPYDRWRIKINNLEEEKDDEMDH